MTHNQIPSETPHEQTLLTRIKALPLATKIVTGTLALAILAGGTIGGIALAGHDSGTTAASESVVTMASTASPTATVKPSVKASAKATPTATVKPTSSVEGAKGSNEAAGTDSGEVVGGNPVDQAQQVPVQVEQGPAAQAPDPAPAPAPAPVPAPAPAPVPVAPAPEPAPPVYVPPVAPSLPAQTLGSIAAARASLGAPAFVPVTAACSLKATAWGSSLDGAEGSIQHAEAVGMIAGNTTGATFSADNTVNGRSGTLNIYRCS